MKIGSFNTFEIVMTNKIDIIKRDENIVEEFKNSNDVHAIAKKYGLSVRTIWNILNMAGIKKRGLLKNSREITPLSFEEPKVSEEIPVSSISFKTVNKDKIIENLLYGYPVNKVARKNKTSRNIVDQIRKEHKITHAIILSARNSKLISCTSAKQIKKAAKDFNISESRINEIIREANI